MSETPLLLQSNTVFNVPHKGLLIVKSQFNHDIVNGMETACRSQLLNYAIEPMACHSVPGALEIPQFIAAYLHHHAASIWAVIAFGCVIRGETYHFELVSDVSARGLQQVAQLYRIPVINQILTVENENQAITRAAEKGCYAADAAVSMGRLYQQLKMA